MADYKKKAEIQNLLEEEETAQPGDLVKRLENILKLPGEITGLDQKGVHELENRLKNDVERLVVTTSDYSPTELVSKASAEVILRGVLVDKGKNQVSLKRNVLNPPSSVKLINATLPQTEKSFMFSSKGQHDSFQKHLNSIGYTHAAEVHGSYLACKGEVGVRGSGNRASKKTSEMLDQVNFESVCHIETIPLAACHLSGRDLKLSPDVIKELNDIEKMMKVSVRKEKCQHFFEKYGSHVKLGTIHFGGSICFVAKYQSHRKSNKQHLQTLLKSAVKAYASASLQIGGFSIGGSVSAEQLKFSSDENQQFEKTELSSITCETVVNGGPIGMGSIPLWKYGLCTYNSTWAVIDNGTVDDFVGIWDLVKNHSSNFKEPEQLALLLREVWKQLYSGTCDTLGQDTMFAMDMLYQLEPKLAEWNSSSNTECIGPEHLEQIVQLVREIKESVHSSQCWVDFLCKSPEMNSFLSIIVKQAHRYSSADQMKIQQMLTELVQPMRDVHFPSRKDVITWIRGSDDEHYYPAMQSIVHDIYEFTDELKQIISKTKIDRIKNQEQTKDTMMLTDLVLCLESFLSFCRDKYQVFLTNILLQTLGYNKDHKTFSTDITLDTVMTFNQNLEKTWSDYCMHRKMGKIQSDAFLLHVLLTLEDSCPKKAKEERFTTLLSEMQSELSESLVDVVNRFISSSPVKLVEMKQAMLDISQGNMSVMTEANDDDMGQLEYLLKAAQDIPFNTFAAKSPNAIETYKSILEKLNLTDYYPGKITLVDARKLRKTSEEKLSDVPWILINKLFNGDLYARDSTMSQVLVSSSEDDGIDDFLSETDKTDTYGMLSTLDVLVVLFGCCDSFLQQALAQKLFQCKLAIPFIYPLGTPNKMMLSLWTLRTIEINSALVTETPMPIVAFLKLGQLPHFSKSKLMNDILSDNNHHTFVNYHCPNGIEERVLSNGLVECSWYVDATKDDSVDRLDGNTLPSSMMLLNLRGDASILDRQRELLCDISSIIVVLATASELERHVELYNAMAKSAQIVIPLILIEGDTLQKMQGEKGKLRQCLGKCQPITNKKKDGKTKGDNLLKADICKALAKHLTDSPGKVLENCFDQQSSNFLTIDEHMDDCEDGKRNAKKAVDPLFNVAVIDRKKVCLPLQEDEWKQFCKLKKDRHRVCVKEELTVQQQINKIDLEMNQQRKMQLNLCKHMSDVDAQFAASLMSGGQQRAQFFLNWTKIMLDKESRAQTSDLRRKYGAKWVELQTAKENKNGSEIPKLAAEVAKLENELAIASIGLEHMFRELGQIYEALHESSSKNESLTTLKTETHKFPRVAADLLLKGYPLELLDGDASGIPITWIRAVFDQLKVLIQDENLFVISVLGIQSSGKSTLLNTMFGLQYAVSAGRCTRGAYIQLIPVDESAGLPFNYVLVIDTEGLRAPELASSKHVHDNELATFAVGLADVTVVNVKGENVSELQDVLQIVVQAFIRMKAVNSNRDYRRACVFIHQNVSDINAKDMMMHERHKIVEKLDKITREAALSENVGDVTNFQQIIKFNQQKHVWYFPDLWLGNPPMAPVNPKYSQKVEEVKDYLLNECAKNQLMFVKPADLFTRINDIWKGILCEDFVFNFRNSLEVRAYAQLDSMYNSLIWELQKMVMAFRQGKATKDLTECRKTSSLVNVANALVSELAKTILEKVENLKKDLEKYFSENKYNEIIIQWKATKMLGLVNEGERQKEASRTYINDLKEKCKMKLIQSQEAESHLDEIISTANRVADKMKGRDLREDEIRKEFDKIWIPFIQKHEVKTKDSTVPVESIVEEVLMDLFKAHRKLLKRELDDNPLRIPLKQALVASITINDIKKEQLNRKQSFTVVLDTIGITRYLREAKFYLYEGTSRMLEKVEQSLKNMCNPQEQVQELTIRKLFKELQQEMDDLHKQLDSRGFLVVPAYRIKVAVLVGRQAVKQFLETQKEHVAKYSAKAYLENYHKMVWDLFKNRVRDSTVEITVKDMFCHLIQELISKKMQERAALLLTTKVMNDFSHGKFHLIMNILKDLANKEGFENYVEYIHNTKNFATRFILRHFDENMFAGEPSEYAKVATGELLNLLENLLKCISEATDHMIEKKEKSLAQWIHLIRSKSELSMPENKFEPICRQHKVNDYNHLKNIIEKELNSWFKEISCKTLVTHSWKDHLVEKVMQSLWGCPALCPFCKEPCSITDPDHAKERSHSCIKHKPQGINGRYWNKSDKLVTDTCGFSLHTKCLFMCGHVCGNCTSGKEWHKYEEYKKYVPEWDIQPDPTNARSKYWMWFMAKYKEDLVRYYKGTKLPDIPPKWENITKEEALDDLTY